MSKQIRFLQQILRLFHSRSTTHYMVGEWKKQQQEREQLRLAMRIDSWYDEYDDRDYYDEEYNE